MKIHLSLGLTVTFAEKKKTLMAALCVFSLTLLFCPFLSSYLLFDKTFSKRFF